MTPPLCILGVCDPSQLHCQSPTHPTYQSCHLHFGPLGSSFPQISADADVISASPLVGRAGLFDRDLGLLPDPARRPGGARLLAGVVPSAAAAAVQGSELPRLHNAAEGRVDEHFLVTVRGLISQFWWIWAYKV